MWRQNGDAVTAVDWFYRQIGRSLGQEAHYLNRLLNESGRRPGPVVKALIGDPRFDEINWKSLEALAKTTNALLGRQVVAEEEIERAWSPMGVDFHVQERSRGLAEYPVEIEQLLKTLARWRAALRAAAAEL
jgi:hypothetical protein